MPNTRSGNNRVNLIVGICMIGIGILFLCWPIASNYAAMVLATIAFIIYGGYQIYIYIRTPRDYKDGWLLASGIIDIIVGFVILWDSPRGMYLTFAFLLGILSLYEGFIQCFNSGRIRRAKQSGAGWVLISGIMFIAMGIFFLITPFAATWAMAYVIAIYLIVGGIALFANGASGQYGVRY